MKILVTGGAGFIASNIVDEYIALGHAVVIIDNLSSGKESYINKQATFYQTDIRNKDEIKKIVEKEKPEVLNHHAAQMSVRYSVENPKDDADINIIGLLNLLEAAKNTGVKKIIFASSGGAAYGNASIIPTPETYAPLLPLSPYGITKLASEYYLYFYYNSYKIPYIALRYANVYGPRQNPHGEAGVVAIFNLKLLNGEVPVINGDGKQTRDYIFVGDVVEANKRALETNEVGSFNIGTGVETNVIQIYEGVRKQFNSNLEAQHADPKLGEQRRSCLDIRYSEQVLQWKPKISLQEGMKRTADFFKQYEKK